MSGLDDNAARVFEDEGFLFFPSLFSVEEVAVLRAAVGGGHGPRGGRGRSQLDVFADEPARGNPLHPS